MSDQTARIQAWLIDLAAINLELAAQPQATSRPRRKRTRQLKSLWEE